MYAKSESQYDKAQNHYKSHDPPTFDIFPVEFVFFVITNGGVFFIIAHYRHSVSHIVRQYWHAGSFKYVAFTTNIEQIFNGVLRSGATRTV